MRKSNPKKLVMQIFSQRWCTLAVAQRASSGSSSISHKVFDKWFAIVEHENFSIIIDDKDLLK